MLDDHQIYSHYEPESERDNKTAGFLFLVAIIGGVIGVIKLITSFLL